MDAEKLERLLSVLRCPRSGTMLRREGRELVSETSERYPIVDGKPILVRRVQPMHVTPPDSRHVSQNISNYSPPSSIAELPGIKIHIGSGNVPCNDPNVVSIDILPNTNVDMVAEAEFLPFADNSIVWAESGAVFEHLYNPVAAAAEVRRVLSPGGQFYIDTAFMQGYHGFPSHFLNMTPQAVETMIVDDFSLMQSYIPPSGSPAVALENILRKFIEALPKPQRERCLSMCTADLLDELADWSKHEALIGQMSEHVRRSLAASTCVVAMKPEGYERRPNDEAFAEAKRNYYAARVGVMQRFYEIEHYRGRVLQDHSHLTGAAPSASLSVLLDNARVTDTLDTASWLKATADLRATDHDLVKVRDDWIRKFLTHPIAPDRVERAETGSRL